MYDFFCLELFCGTKSFTKVLNTYTVFDTTTLDKNPIFKPNLLMNIEEYDPNPCSYNLIWASPPCERFSLMSAHRNWVKLKGVHYPNNPKTNKAVMLIDKTIEIIASQDPKYWFIENPRGMLQFVIDKIFRKYAIKDYYLKTVTYCKYGEKYMKPTHIWTNFKGWNPRPICKRGDKCHETVKAGEKGGVISLPDNIHRGIVPRELCQEIIDSILKDQGERI